MNYRELLLSENTDSRNEAWKEYREELTSYILSSINSILLKKKIKDNRLRRVKNSIGNYNQILELNSKPTLAIWGAGGCNDIDVLLLSKYFSLVLIDDNLDIIKEVKKKYNLSDQECICTNLHFWDITEDDYEMFLALINDGASVKDIETFLNELVDNMINIEYRDINGFDFSVCVGLASQLNSRFMALFYDSMLNCTRYSNEEVQQISTFIKNLNNIAVERLMRAINATTKSGCIYGYELYSFFDDSIMCDKYDEINITIDEYNHSRDSSINIWPEIDIEGCKQFDYLIRKKVVENESENSVYGKGSLLDNMVSIWPFSDDKKYIMIFRVFD